VATLRIWEQRYQAVQPATAASGHRLYSPEDVQRVLLLKQLTTLGHAIGSIASLSLAQLQALATAPETVVGGSVAPGPRASALRVVVVGSALAMRLQRPTVLKSLRLGLRVVTSFESLDAAASAAGRVQADCLLWQAPELPSAVPPALLAVQTAVGAGQLAVLYRYASPSACDAFLARGARICRDPADDDTLGAWLASLEPTRATDRKSAVERRVAVGGRGEWSVPSVAPRRFDDAALTAIAGISPTLACECPKHVAELLMQLSSFESYSANCLHQSPQDAELHSYLQHVAGAARALFEAALERVAQHEGLPLAQLRL
jgi:MerR family transcriptional regulator, light-induced transcriptional regulator